MKGDRVFTPPTDELRRRLRGGDPCGDGQVPSAERRAAARRAMLAATPPRSGAAARHLRPVFLTALAILLTLAVGLSLWRATPSPRKGPASPSSAVVAERTPASLDLRAPGGTRLLFFYGPPAAVRS